MGAVSLKFPVFRRLHAAGTRDNKLRWWGLTAFPSYPVGPQKKKKKKTGRATRRKKLSAKQPHRWGDNIYRKLRNLTDNYILESYNCKLQFTSTTCRLSSTSSTFRQFSLNVTFTNIKLAHVLYKSCGTTRGSYLVLNFIFASVTPPRLKTTDIKSTPAEF